MRISDLPLKCVVLAYATLALLLGGHISLASSASKPINQNASSSFQQSCPNNLSHLAPELERLLENISSSEFKKTIRQSVKASIPEAIDQADGIAAQIKFLKKDLLEEEHIQRESEEIARMDSSSTEGNLKPCPAGQEGSYCSAVEQYYVSSARLLVYRGFLQSLQCYQREGRL